MNSPNSITQHLYNYEAAMAGFSPSTKIKSAKYQELLKAPPNLSYMVIIVVAV